MKSKEYYKKAAYFSIAAPFIADFVLTVTKESTKNSPTSSNIVLGLAVFIILSGLTFGVLSLIKSEKSKSTVIPATIGVLCNLAVFGIAYATIHEIRNEVNIFSIQFAQDQNGYEYKEMIYGEVPKRIDVEMVLEQISQGIKKSCPDCRITEAKVLGSLPEGMDGVFDNKQLDFSYVSLDALDGSGIKTRNVFPGIDPQPTCVDLEQYVNAKKAGVKNFAEVTCVEAL